MTSTTGLVPATGPSGATLLKTDVLGRIRHTREQRERVAREIALRPAPITVLEDEAGKGEQQEIAASVFEQLEAAQGLIPKRFLCRTRRPRRAAPAQGNS